MNVRTGVLSPDAMRPQGSACSFPGRSAIKKLHAAGTAAFLHTVFSYFLYMGSFFSISARPHAIGSFPVAVGIDPVVVSEHVVDVL